MATASGTRFYQPELDAVRFLAFLAVFISHAVPPDGLSQNAAAAVRACALGLPLFFCLSAYLITRLLLLERDRTGTVHLAQFYKRRMLRIWPLYLLALAVSAANSAWNGTLHQTGTWYLLALLMLGNVAWWVRTTVAHLWSISVEEQFYLFWPTAVRRLRNRGLALLACGLILMANATLAYFGLRHAHHDGRVWTNTFVQMEPFAVGILLALWHSGPIRRTVPLPARPPLFAAALAGWFVAVRFCGTLGAVDTQVSCPLALLCGYALASLGCVAILQAVHGWPRWSRLLVYLGRVSYGLYVFHAPALFVGERLLLRHGRGWSVAASFGLTVATAALSYRFFERPFLLLKQRFELVQSRPVDLEPQHQQRQRQLTLADVPAATHSTQAS